MDGNSDIEYARAFVSGVSLADRRRAENAGVRRLILIGSLLAASTRTAARDTDESRNAAALAELWELQLITARPALARMESER